MAYWVCFASSARAGEADTLDFALRHKVLYRPTHTDDGKSLIANVANLRPRDYILLIYRQAGPPRAQVIGRIATPVKRVPGLRAIERLQGELALAMRDSGYPLQADGSQEVIRLEYAEPCDLTLEGMYGGHNAIHKVASADTAKVRELIRSERR